MRTSEPSPASAGYRCGWPATTGLVVDAIFTGKERQSDRRIVCRPTITCPTCGLHAGVGAGKGAGLNLSGERPRMAVHAEA